jgi:hypothetical protein
VEASSFLLRDHDAHTKVVTTADELVDAIRNGSSHIELRSHVHFTSPMLSALPLGFIPDTVKSIRVRSSLRIGLLRAVAVAARHS